MGKPKWLIWLGSALILGGAVILASYSHTLHQRTDAQRRAREWLSRTTTGHRPMPAPPVRRGRGDGYSAPGPVSDGLRRR
jgi:hypothetical protein